MSVINNDALLTAAQASRWFMQRGQNVSQRMISDWRRAGHLAPAKLDKAGRIQRPYYRLGDLIQIEGDTRMSGLSHRKQLQAA